MIRRRDKILTCIFVYWLFWTTSYLLEIYNAPYVSCVNQRMEASCFVLWLAALPAIFFALCLSTAGVNRVGFLCLFLLCSCISTATFAMSDAEYELVNDKSIHKLLLASEPLNDHIYIRQYNYYAALSKDAVVMTRETLLPGNILRIVEIRQRRIDD